MRLKSHLGRLTVVISASVFTLSSCKELKQEKESHTTDAGEDLRKGVGFSSISSSGSAISSFPGDQLTSGDAETCGSTELLFNGNCLSTSVFYIWENESLGSSYISSKNFEECSANLEGCPDLNLYSWNGGSFRGVVQQLEAGSEFLVPMYELSSPSGVQYLTSQKFEKDQLVSERGYQGGNVLFYLLPGSLGSSQKLVRYAKVEGLGPWKYQLSLSDSENYKFDVSFGNTAP